MDWIDSEIARKKAIWESLPPGPKDRYCERWRVYLEISALKSEKRKQEKYAKERAENKAAGVKSELELKKRRLEKKAESARIECENCGKKFLLKSVYLGSVGTLKAESEGMRVHGKNLCRECACADEINYREFWFDATISNNEISNPQVRYHFDVRAMIDSARAESDGGYEG